MPSLAGSVARVFIFPPSFFPLWNGRGKQKGKQSKRGARNLLIRRLANRKFTVAASQTGPSCGATKIQVSLYAWQTHVHVCGVWVRSVQIGAAKACYELFPDMMCLWRLLWSTLLVKVQLLSCFWGNIALFSAHARQNCSLNIQNWH